VARIRQIKPGFFLDDELASCCRDARLLFIGLWVIADRAGRLADRPPRIKAQVFPYDQDIGIDEIEHYLEELTDGCFIERYMTDQGKRLIEIRNFEKHQHFHAKEPDSELPPPEHLRNKHRTSTVPASDKYGASTVQEPVKTDAGTGQEPDKTGSSRLGIGYLVSGIGDRGVGVGIGEGSGEGKTKPPASKSHPHTHTAAADFVLSEELREWSEAAAPDIDPEAEAEKFRDYYARNGTTFTDLPAAFRKWIRDAIERQHRAREPSRPVRESVAEHNARVFAELNAMSEDEIRVMQGLEPRGGKPP
jgi:hypothetical protein